MTEKDNYFRYWEERLAAHLKVDKVRGINIFKDEVEYMGVYYKKVDVIAR